MNTIISKLNNILERLDIDKDIVSDLSLTNNTDTVDFDFDSDSLSDQQHLEMALVQLIPLKKYYDHKSIPEEIFYDTLSDLKYRVKRYHKNNNEYGLTSHDIKWLGFIYNAEIFKIHNLKFRKYMYTDLEIERSGIDSLRLYKDYEEKFYDGLPVVYVHIEQDADLSKESVDKSFLKAEEFFKTYYPKYEFEYFICRTWLLYPGLDNILDETSNIIQFKNRFEIIGTHNNPTQALSRIYNTSDLDDIKNMPKTTSLTKTAYKNMDSLGVGVGIIKRSQ